MKAVQVRSVTVSSNAAVLVFKLTSLSAGYLLDRSASRHLCREYGSSAASANNVEIDARLNELLFIAEGGL
jgi:hypothetical protein